MEIKNANQNDIDVIRSIAETNPRQFEQVAKYFFWLGWKAAHDKSNEWAREDESDGEFYNKFQKQLNELNVL